MPLSEFPLPHEDASGDDGPEIRVPPPGPMSKSAAMRLERVECPAFGARRSGRATESGEDMTPIVLASGKGANVFDVDGNRYVDLAAGFGSVLTGHGATGTLRALEAQSDRLIQGLGDVYSADSKIALLERLAALHPTPGARVLLAQSGSDAVTAAIKTTALATGKPGLVAFEGAYHGLGYAPLAACGYRESFRAPFSTQLNAHVSFAPYPSIAEQVAPALEAVERALLKGDVGAVLVEPVLGRGGCVVPPDGFLVALAELTHRHGALLIADEIWTGLGRCGAMARSVALGVAVDVLCFGKGLGGGLPISACVAPESVMSAWARSGEVIHTSTHAGFPLACATSVATLDTIRFRHLAERAEEVGGHAREHIRAATIGASKVVDVRGVGLLIGVELANAEVALKATRRLLRLGYIVLTGGVAGETLTLTPPLTIGEARLSEFAGALRSALA